MLQSYLRHKGLAKRGPFSFTSALRLPDPPAGARLSTSGDTMRLLAALAALVSFGAHAATVNLQWVNPTQYADGTSLAAADIASTRIEYGTCNGSAFGTKAGEVTATGAATSATADRPPGTWCYRAYTKVVASKGGGESVASSVAQGVVPFPAPGAPTGLTVTVTVTVTTP